MIGCYQIVPIVNSQHGISIGATSVDVEHLDEIAGLGMASVAHSHVRKLGIEERRALTLTTFITVTFKVENELKGNKVLAKSAVPLAHGVLGTVLGLVLASLLVVDLDIAALGRHVLLEFDLLYIVGTHCLDGSVIKKQSS